MQSAKLAKAQGCKQFHVVSSQGASKDSSFLYPKVKVCVSSCLYMTIIKLEYFMYHTVITIFIFRLKNQQTCT